MSSGGKQQPKELSESQLAAFVAGLDYDTLPEDARRLAERCFVDTVGVSYAGMMTGAGATAADALTSVVGDGPVSLLGRDDTTSVLGGAFINGTASHGLDFDDVSSGMSGHPSVTLVPPLLAVGEAEGASGRALLTGFVAGFETECYLAQAVSPGHYEAGWHATSTFGVFGAAAATASLLDLGADQTRHALNSAASMAAGLKRNFGSMTKPMHVGHATRAGVTAALLAENGFTGGKGATTAEGGFTDLYSGSKPPHPEDSHSVGDSWATTTFGVGVKKYPCCYFTHTGIEAASRLSENHGIDPADVERVRVVASQGADDALQHEDPATGLEGKFSMHYTVAAAITRDRVGLAEFEDENVTDPAVQTVRDRVRFEVDQDLDYGSHRTSVTITTAEDKHSLTLDAPPGTHEDPLSDEELREKFRMCVSRAADEDRVDELYRGFDSLRTVENVRDLPL
jgi:2-methylcitrate dehydratase PrpD